MRLMHPSPGEAYDRLTILNLKIKFAREKKKENIIGGFLEEQKALVDYMISNKHYVVPPDLANDLGRINARLWELEDTQRKILKENNWEDNLTALLNDTDTEDVVIDFARNAKTIIELNDARAETVQKINASCGINAPEKLHDIVKNS